jgi:translocation and assembly module TamB
MTQRMKLLRRVLLGAGAFIAILAIAAILLVQTAWFRNYVKQTIITSIADSAGGKVEAGSFEFDWTHLRADITSLVIHGNEPPNAAPLARVARIQVDLRLFGNGGHLWGIAGLNIVQPEANVIVYADGRTNLPEPRKKSNTSPLESVVDLAIGHFEIADGRFTFAAQKYAFSARGNNLHAQLAYNTLSGEYSGQVSLQPAYMASGRNTPVELTLTIPVLVGRNKVELHGARITSAHSSIAVDASLDDFQRSHASAHVAGRIALADLKDAGNLPLKLNAANTPTALDLDVNATTQGPGVQIASLKLTLGRSSLQASGALDRGLQFNSRLSLDELARLTGTSTTNGGQAAIQGVARLGAENSLSIDRLQVAAYGAEFSGNASVQSFSGFQLRGNLRQLELRNALLALRAQPLPYGAVIAGSVNVQGDFASPMLRHVKARADLSIAPAGSGIPGSGRLNAEYSGASDELNIQHSLLSLPHSRITLDGAPGKQLNLALTTTNLDDLLAVLPASSRPRIALERGQASFTGAITGHLTSPHIAGHVAANRLVVAGRRFDSLVADASASSAGVVVQNGSLTREVMQARFSGSLGLRDWQPFPNAPVAAKATIEQGDLADLLALAGQPRGGYSGQLTANVDIDGTFGNPSGAATLSVIKGSLEGQPFDRAAAQVKLSDQLVTVSNASFEAGAARVQLNATYQHPRDSFTIGQLRANLKTTQLDLGQLEALQKRLPRTSGIVQLDGSFAANVTHAGNGTPGLQLASVGGNVSIRGLQSEGQQYGDLTATASTSGVSVNYTLTSNFAGSSVNASGSTKLAPEYPTIARATLANLPVERALALAHRTDVPATGLLSGTASFNGTIAAPQGSADVDIAKATFYDDVFDRVHARISYSPRSIDLAQLEIAAGPSRASLTAHYDHPAGNLESGTLQFQVDPGRVDLARLKTLAARYPNAGGLLSIDASGIAEIRASAPRIQVREVRANVKATELIARGKNLGDLSFTANTASGHVTVALDSSFAQASIQGRGSVQLAPGYATDAQLTFKNITWTGLAPLFGLVPKALQDLEAGADGQASLNGSLTDVTQLRGSVQLTRLELSSKSPGLQRNRAELLQNQGPISATLDRGAVRIQSAHLSGPQTNIEATGSIPLSGQSLDVTLNGSVDLAVLEKFDRAITSSGAIALKATVRGTLTKPELGGQVELKNSSFDYVDFPTGLSKANGVVLLNGNSAVIRDLTAEVGGGRVTVTGSAGLNGSLRFGLDARARRVRVRIQPGLSVLVSANISASGTSANNSISGNVTVDQVSYASRSDLGSLLALAAPPVDTSPPSQILDNMRLDLRVRSSNSLTVQSNMAENVELFADLTIRGTVAHPGVLGRVNITDGKLVFFGSTFSVNTGVISFFNPVHVEPILDLDLETQAQGVDVVLKVTGPIDNMKLSYTSDPPLQFQEIVALLANGTTPTSDPTLLANQPSIAPQSFQQMGESAIVGKAVADPVSNQLQRVFGVTQLKINPTFSTGSQIPSAQFTLQQQISNNLTFTYVTGLNTANAQTIQVQWTFTPRWSAQALRDYNGIFSVNLQYKIQVH